MGSPDNTPAAPAGDGAATRPTPFAALRHRDFRLLWAGQFFSLTGSQMQLVAINWHVYIIMRPHGEQAAAAALGLVGLVRVLPIVVCSLVGGVVADALDRKRLMLVTQTVMLSGAAALAAFTASGLVGRALLSRARRRLLPRRRRLRRHARPRASTLPLRRA